LVEVEASKSSQRELPSDIAAFEAAWIAFCAADDSEMTAESEPQDSEHASSRGLMSKDVSSQKKGQRQMQVQRKKASK
jgi:hypothetical protein